MIIEEFQIFLFTWKKSSSFTSSFQVWVLMPQVLLSDLAILLSWKKMNGGKSLFSKCLSFALHFPYDVKPPLAMTTHTLSLSLTRIQNLLFAHEISNIISNRFDYTLIYSGNASSRWAEPQTLCVYCKYVFVYSQDLSLFFLFFCHFNRAAIL